MSWAACAPGLTDLTPEGTADPDRSASRRPSPRGSSPLSQITTLAGELSDLQAKRSGIATELKTIHSWMERGEVTEGLKERVSNLSRGLIAVADQIADADAAYRLAITDGYKAGQLAGEHGDGARQLTPPGPAGSPPVDSARRRLDTLVKAHSLPDSGAERLTELLTSATPIEQNTAARWTLATGDEHWTSAFLKLATDPTHGPLLWTPAEQDAYRKVATVHAELKAMSTADNAGGYLIPLTLDPSIMLTSAGRSIPCAGSPVLSPPPPTSGRVSPPPAPPPSGKPKPLKPRTDHRP